MARQLPFLAMDGVLCDYPLPMFGGKTTTTKETKMGHVMTSRETEARAKKLVARLLGQDAALDDETVGKIKQFLEDKISAKDHETLCSMLDGEGEAEDDIENGGTPLPSVKLGGAAADAAADFSRRYPGLANVRIDNGSLPLRRRPASTSSADAASFAARFPGLAKVKLA
jgi:hypothetical protein